MKRDANDNPLSTPVQQGLKTPTYRLPAAKAGTRQTGVKLVEIHVLLF